MPLSEAHSSNTGAIRRRNQSLILKAAAEEFVKSGYKGTSLQVIAQRAELPKANILYYFKSKEGLYRALISDIVELWNNAFEGITADDEPSQAIEIYIRSKLHYSRTHPLHSRLFAMEFIQGAPNLDESLRAPIREWALSRSAVLQTWIDQGLIQARSPMDVLFAIWSTTQFYADFDAEINFIYQNPLSDSQFELAEQNLVELLLRGLGLLKSEP
ncbi:TetR family transcriptional regulator [Alginatibacterium sediminis]|uniref:TetR family transcriptional regulator n=1 Tax=Alginatibacterium sediminis TaxID=2164068 RepID=A0A420EA09_9ALTE|nr:TetR family transcriptional regulator C-terminal domain-containing protein [Alginatibacterium sediminis]RKF17517.1 TetR family transcriptional regulator [Alginatibacterium sediminis]